MSPAGQSTMRSLMEAGLAATFLVSYPAQAAGDPAGPSREVFIEQVGDSNRAQVTQRAPFALVRLKQSGTGNDSLVNQTGSGQATYDGLQMGDDHLARIAQQGAGFNHLAAVQRGQSNHLSVTQDAAIGAANQATLAQDGVGNTLELTQSGRDNQAAMSQKGDANAMTLAQHGTDNQVRWDQTGTGLPNLSIVQEGGGRLIVSQTGG